MLRIAADIPSRTELPFPPCSGCGHQEESTYALPTIPHGVQCFLECGEPPSVADIPGIKAYQCALRRGRDDLNARRAVITNHLVFLDDRQKEFNRMIEATAAALCPIQPLPVEVLMTIYRHAVTGTELFYKDIALNPLWTFSHVCSRWRQAALASYETWAMIRIEFDRENYAFHNGKIMETILTRSREYPLSIFVRWGFDNTLSTEQSDSESDNSASPDYKLLRLLVLASAKRWRSVDFLLCGSIKKNFPFMPYILPMLEKLSIRSYSGWQQFAPIRQFSNLPALTRLTLTRCGNPSLSSLPLPWEQIIELKSDFWPKNHRDIETILQKVSSLQICDFHLHIIGETDSVVADSSAVAVSTLHTLRLSKATLLSYFTAPGLRSLTLSLAHQPTVLSRLSDFLQRSNFHLEHFEIALAPYSVSPWDSETMLRLFGLFPTLSSIKVGIYNHAVAVEFCSALANPELLPNLRELEVFFGESTSTIGPCYTELFLPSLFSRNRRPCSSTPSPTHVQVTVQSEEVLGIGYRETMKMLCAQGIDVQVGLEKEQ